MLIKLIEVGAVLLILISIAVAILGVSAPDPAKRTGAFEIAGLGFSLSGFVLMGAAVVDHANLYTILLGAGLAASGSWLKGAATRSRLPS